MDHPTPLAIVTLFVLATTSYAQDRIYLSNLLGVTSGSAAQADNPPYTTITTNTPYGYGADCPGPWSNQPIDFTDAGSFAKGIGQHPPLNGFQQITFDLTAIRAFAGWAPAARLTFSARAGIDATDVAAQNGAAFTVLLDGATVSSAFVNGSLSPSVPTSAVIPGAATSLALRTSTLGSFNSNHACWADAQVILNSSCVADLGRSGGLAGPDGGLDNNDFIVFIDLFFNQDSRADVGQTGGVPAGDALFDNNDFVVYIDQFFAGCTS